MISIVDYGLGNIKAFQNIYNQLNLDCVVARDAEALRNASKIILPGVGAFDFAMLSLNKSGMRATLDELVMTKNIPILGICVGMQMLTNSSEEGCLDGLGYVDGSVKKFSREELAGYPLPHMGWNAVEQGGRNHLFNNIPNATRFYFLHSYYFDCAQELQKIASAEYGVKFTCGVRNKNIYGVQFHPEKSHA
ncbi:imidazole glycerol phosphate synthase subunit HisH, partial [Alphaproteobacteria bacterium]|nr:imidazole glycerol phosphate synthase subunit HisH [Alphaproteobacteria bacterium]